ncbi:circularly permutated Ras protein 1 [Chiloscyllium plagiosum]|uniref:circularly permutated Ras protein 1 n=1 Tax=Chiloscyllium plagiosum TaxID=36176 RepID=UPI001CB7D6AF|nr:circularly permutated Ras protein 1 [Chiloscyllium plagiosum]
MEFAYSHIVYNSQNIPSPNPRNREHEHRHDRSASVPDLVENQTYSSTSFRPLSLPASHSFHQYDNRFLKSSGDEDNCVYATVPKSSHGNRAKRPIPPARSKKSTPIDEEDNQAPPLPPRLNSFTTHQLSATLPCSLNPPQRVPPPRPKRTFPAPKNTGSQPSKKANVNVVSVNLGKLVDVSNLQTQAVKAIYCQRCSAALSSISRIHQKYADIIWPCEFCSKQNVITRSFSTIPKSQDVIYLSGSTNEDYINVDDSLVVFCIDVSGSMCATNEIEVSDDSSRTVHVSRLQSVQEAILRSLSLMTQTCPQKRVALVTFNDEVTVYGDGLGEPIRLSDYQLLDSDYLKERGREFPAPRCIAESLQALNYRVHEMREQGATALGPAALISVSIASKKPGSKVIICTDGRANTGLGYLESVEEDIYECSRQFYTDVGEQATLSGVIVSVLTIEGTDCRLAELGKLADQSGGRINIVDPTNLSKEIQATLEDDVIATNATVTFVVPEQMYFGYEEETGNKYVKRIGNVTKDTELTFEFGIKEGHVQAVQVIEKLPFQLQVSFTTQDNRQACRVISQERHITSNSSLVEDNVNITVLGIHAAQLSGRLTMEGKVKEARREVEAQKELIQKIVEKKQNQKEEDIYQNWLCSVAVVCEDLTNPQQVESIAQGKNITENSDSVFKVLSDEVANMVYRLKNAKSKMLKKPVSKPKSTLVPML